MPILTSACRAQSLETPDWTKAIYVSPTGDNNAAGTREKPFATIQKAMSTLPETGGGVIALLGGTYKGDLFIRRRADDVDKGEAQLLTITAAPGEKVVFQGGEPITKWSSWNGKKGLFVVEAPDRAGINEAAGYLDVWENSARVRYRTQFDAAGVEAFPGSVCLLGENRILVHTRDGRDPQANDLWRNRAANGITLLRENVVLRGVRFENFLGGSEARAISVGNNTSWGRNYTGVVVADCTVSNSVRGLSMTANGARVVNCDLRDVGMGILSHGVDTIVENCVIQSASGAFAVSVLNQHQRDGIRLYLPANGAKITNCITAGFWAGLYIKTDSAAADARPMVAENNIFLDGIRAGAISAETAPQPRNRYIGNIMGPDEERIDPMKDKALVVATFESNYFFNRGGTSKGSNVAGENPFVDLAKGDLRIKPGVAVPAHWSTPVRARKAQIEWSPNLAAAIARSLAPQKIVAAELKFTKSPVAVASQMGAIITARLSSPAQSTLRYRKAGTSDWQTATGIDNTLSRPEVIIGSAPVERDETPEYGVLFTLLDGQLEANSDYEYSVEVTAKDQPPLRSETKKFRTVGGPKTIVVRAGNDSANANGTTENPFAQLQDAFDNALPGDTVQLEKGVYTAPAILVHGGTGQAPLTIQGAGALDTILDGGKEPPVMLELRQTGNIVIRDLQVRWFGNAGISGSETENVTVERCRFFNTSLRGSETPNGSGIALSQSPGWTIAHSIFAKMEFGIRASGSPRLKLLNNTAFRNMYAGFHLTQSSQGSVITGNSFTFTGNDSIVFNEPDVAAFSQLTSDFNNYGAVIRRSETIRPENEFKPAERYGPQGASKAITSATIGGKPNRFTRMEDWRKFSGLDANSIFADPEYSDPLNVDFRVLPNSPNILPDGKVIGASPVVK